MRVLINTQSRSCCGNCRRAAPLVCLFRSANCLKISFRGVISAREWKSELPYIRVKRKIKCRSNVASFYGFMNVNYTRTRTSAFVFDSRRG